jgi:hypothetical protein
MSDISISISLHAESLATILILLRSALGLVWWATGAGSGRSKSGGKYGG